MVDSAILGRSTVRLSACTCGLFRHSIWTGSLRRRPAACQHAWLASLGQDGNTPPQSVSKFLQGKLYFAQLL